MAIDSFPKTYNEMKKYFGFNKDNVVYAYCGNTYPCKEYFKGAGCRYNAELGWHNTKPLDSIPAETYMISFTLEEICDTTPNAEYFVVKSNLKDIVTAKVHAATGYEEPTDEPIEETGEFIGEVGDRLRNIKVYVEDIKLKDSYYGTMAIYTFTYEDKALVWMTSSYQEIEKDTEIIISGTIKEHKVFRGVRQTHLTRCRVAAL